MKSIKLNKAALFEAYMRSKRRIIFLDYDGTLAPFQLKPELALPTDDIKNLLYRLSEDNSNQVVIISGREQKRLEEWLGTIPLTLVAEHGAFHKKPSQQWKSYFPLQHEWKNRMLPPMKALETQFDGTKVEEKQFSLTWHYRNIKTPLSTKELNQILAALRALPNKIEFLIYEESYAIELRTLGIDKGRFAGLHAMNDGPYNFMLAIGDGRTDEDLFKVIGSESFSIKVGESNNSYAQYYLENQEDVIPFLSDLLSFSGSKL